MLLTLQKFKGRISFDLSVHLWADPEGETPPGKIQVALGFLRNTGTDTPREARGRFLQPSVKYIDD